MKECPSCIVSLDDNYNVCWNCSYNFTSKKVDGFVSNDIDIKSVNVKPRKMDCLRCKTTMFFEQNIKLREGFNFGALGDFGNLLSNRSSFEIYVCPNCDKVEFFLPRLY